MQAPTIQQALESLLVTLPSAPSTEEEPKIVEVQEQEEQEEQEPNVNVEHKYADSRHPDSRHPDSRHPDSRHPDSRHPLFDPTPLGREVPTPIPAVGREARDAHAPSHNAHDTMKRAVDSTLAMYCKMRDNQDDFYDAEVDLIYKVVEQVISTFLPKLNVKQDLELSRERVQSYLEAYYNLHKLKQAQDRRIQFCSEFEDMFHVGDISVNMAQYATMFADAIDAKACEIDKLVAPKAVAPRAVAPRAAVHARSSGPCTPTRRSVPNLKDLLALADKDEQRGRKRSHRR